MGAKYAQPAPLVFHSVHSGVQAATELRYWARHNNLFLILLWNQNFSRMGTGQLQRCFTPTAPECKRLLSSGTGHNTRLRPESRTGTEFGHLLLRVRVRVDLLLKLLLNPWKWQILPRYDDNPGLVLNLGTLPLIAMDMKICSWQLWLWPSRYCDHDDQCPWSSLCSWTGYEFGHPTYYSYPMMKNTEK